MNNYHRKNLFIIASFYWINHNTACNQGQGSWIFRILHHHHDRDYHRRSSEFFFTNCRGAHKARYRRPTSVRVISIQGNRIENPL